MSNAVRNQTKEDPQAETWIAEVLPRDAALSLVRAARLAKTLPVGSLARAQAIRNAEKKAKTEYPQCFRHDDGYRQ